MRGGEIVASAGDPTLVCFLRSSAKPIQALPLVRVRPDLDDAEIAIACASHRAEPAQIAAARNLLEAGGNTEADLECGEQEGRLPGAIHHNCSGKHAGFLALARAEGWETSGYRLAEHPVQRAVSAEVAAAAGLAEEAIPTAIDGCGVVTFALSLERMAAAFSRLTELDGAERVLAAMRAHPELVGGQGSLDTDLMQTHPGWIAKGGAEGLFCALAANGTGYALKSEDGSTRPLRAALGRFLGEDLGVMSVENSRGEVVGDVQLDPTDAAAYEEQLAKVWVKPPPKLTGLIEIHEYDPEWPVLYEREEARIREILGRESCASSTRARRPCRGCRRSRSSTSCSRCWTPPTRTPMRPTSGGRLSPVDPRAQWFEHRVFKGPDTNVNLHVFSAGCEETDRMLLFRDWLRENTPPGALRRRQARARGPGLDLREQYADAKTAVVREIMARAESGKS